MKLTIRANQSKLSRALSIATGSIRLYVRDEPYQNGYTSRTLVNFLSKGGKNLEGFTVPARPVLKQFFRDNKIEIRGIVEEIHPWTFRDNIAKNAYEKLANRLLTLFRAWVAVGSVVPSNAESTIAKKGFNAPFYDTGNLLQFFDTEVKIDSTHK